MSGGRVEEVVKRLAEIRAMDARGEGGRLFTYLYETGDPGVKEVSLRAFEMFLDTNALDPTVFKSALFFERELVSFASSLAGGVEGVVGTVTYGGTESIILAAMAAREWYRSLGGSRTPGIVAPQTVHPSVRKAASYLGMRLSIAPVDPGSKRVDIDRLASLVDDGTAMVVVSAPNYPYGTVDDVRGVAEALSGRRVWLHVDACIGGFILPFMRELGLYNGAFAFDVEGVYSVSMDLHKYGYSPKGASVLLFRDGSLKKHSIFADLRWPGYPFINATVLSSRSVAPLAAAWAVANYLGRRGYLELARKAVEARDEIMRGLESIGFRSIAPIESTILSVALDDPVDTLRFHANMSRRGWILGLQPGVKGLAPPNIHLTISPIHKLVTPQFLRDARASSGEPLPEELEEARHLLESRGPLELAGMIGRTPYDQVIIAWILSSIPPDVAEDLARELTVEVYHG
ncbi:pyridoxal phosphate-dependent decarboxylase family protein [Aeropyrum camini]|uniref:Pyridoxal-dependent decarboxylase n=1 Tax=Aeropyrum camini SY1 = JCM 12091 TaxID=1198449 RepID=U3TBG8_9CREN|nr:aspartate aminotransferase family protein [Aeropyrum camini]BAN90887.1 pyridoxal-dependent decarboxylase [Aeropyrum camini SY1 = JCM 12091]